MSKRTPISRRTLLRGGAFGGASVAVPIPQLTALFNSNGTAYAQGAPLRKIFGLWFFGNGIVVSRWNPTTTGVGDAWQLSESLKPLAPVKNYLSVLTGFEQKTRSGGAPHGAGPAGMLTGAPATGGLSMQLPTVDAVISKMIGGETKFRSLEVAVSRAVSPATVPIYKYVSFSGPGTPMPSEGDPRKVFTRLFTGGAPMPTGGGAPDPAIMRAVDAKRSILDAIKGDAEALKGRLGRMDAPRLEQHLEGIRALEKRLAVAPPTAGCATPAEPTVLPDTTSEARKDVNTVQSELVALALACDLTRVFAVTWCIPAAHVIYTNIGLTKGEIHNNYAHGEGGEQPEFAKSVLYTMECFSEFLQKMKATPDGAGNLLDTSAVFATSCVAAARAHSMTDYPILLAGKANGKLKTDVHYRAPAKENTTNVLISLHNMFGANITEFGIGVAKSNQPGPSAIFT